MRPSVAAALTVLLLSLACGTRPEKPGRDKGRDRERAAPEAPADPGERGPGGRPDDRGPGDDRGSGRLRDRVFELETGPDSRGEPRSAMVHVPKDYDASRKYPVIWAFHGGRGTSAKEMVPNFAEQLDGEFILVFPNGQLGDKARGAFFVEDGRDMRHVEFVRKLHAELSQRYSVDPERQYVAGFSSGAHMTWQLACHAPDLFAGFAPVAHYLLARYAEGCTPDPVRPLILIGSRGDERAPYAGQDAKNGDPYNLGADKSLAFWAERAGCGPEPTEERLPGGKSGAHLTWRCERAALEHVRLDNVGHEWPGGPERNKTNPADEADATGLILDFFRRRAGL